MLIIKQSQKVSLKDIKTMSFTDRIIIVGGRSNKLYLPIQNIVLSSYINSSIIYEDFVYVGLQDGNVIRVDIKKTYDSDYNFRNNFTEDESIPKESKEGIFPYILLSDDSEEISGNLIVLAKHTDNVSCMVVYNNDLYTSSWDGTVKKVNLLNFDNVEVVNVNGISIWSIDVLNESLMVLGSADKCISVFFNNFLSKHKVHLTAVRSVKFVFFEKENILTKLQNVDKHLFEKESKSLDSFNDTKAPLIYSLGNDGRLLITTLNGLICKSKFLKNFCYSMDINEKNIVVSGEYGYVALLDLDLNVISSIQLESQSVWSVKFLNNGTIFCCTSDGTINELIIKENDTKIIKENEYIKESKQEENDSEKPLSKIGYITEAKTEENNSSTSKKEYKLKDSGYKIDDGKVFQLVENEWVLIGHVDQKDHTLTIEVDNKNLQINFNDNEDVNDVASNFIAQNNLNPVYQQEIVEFINKNFKKKTGLSTFIDFNIQGIKKFMDDNTILKNLDEPDIKNSKDVNRILLKYLHNENNFFVVDCFRFFHKEGYELDFQWLQWYSTQDKKNATVWMKLVTNLYENQPFNLEILKAKANRIIDLGQIDKNIISKYKNNYETVLN